MPEFTFYKCVEQALKNIHDPVKLGQESPLAAPFLLGKAMPQIATATSEERGKALQRIIKDTISKIDDDAVTSQRQILEQYYIKNLTQIEALEHFGLARGPFNTHRQKAISKLTALLIDELKPAISLEKPPSLPRHFYDRSDVQAGCLSVLQQDGMVWITGQGGIGKSTLMSSVAQSWASASFFWLTLSPNINDNVQYLAFALGYFLSQLGQPALWQECIASPDFIASKSGRGKLLDMIRNAVDQLSDNDNQIVFCFDDVDKLQQTQNTEQKHFARLLESLGSIVPMILTGQNAITDASAFYALSGISQTSQNAWLQEVHFALSDRQRDELYRYTQGNPRLIGLAITLLQQGDSIAELLEHFHTHPGIYFLIERMMQRLSQLERAILVQLSVFRVAAPLDAWHLADTYNLEDGNKAIRQTTEIAQAISRLITLQLIESHTSGTIQLLPVYRDTIFRLISVENLPLLHQWAAQKLAERGLYTAALRHYIECGQSATTVMLWHEHKQDEISQGQAYIAYQLLSQIDSKKISAEIGSHLSLHLAELELLLGDSKKASQTLEELIQDTPLVFAIRAGILGGQIANDQGEFSNAQEYFEQAIRQSKSLIDLQLALAHKGLAWMHMRERSLTQARYEALQARYEVENVLGYILETDHKYFEAIESFQQALRTAEDIAYEQGMAKTCTNLAGTHIWLGEYDEALRYQNRAERIYLRIGDQPAIVGEKINRALLCNMMGNHQDSLNVLNVAIDEGAKLPSGLPSWPQALITQGMAEAYLGLKQLEDAENSARLAIEAEEEGVSADAYRTLGEVMAAKGNFALAERYINDSIAHLQQAESPDLYLLAIAWRALARVYQAQEKYDNVEGARERAIHYFQTINLAHELKRT